MQDAEFAWAQPVTPGNDVPVASAATELLVDCAAVAAAVVQRILRLPVLPRVVPAAVATSAGRRSARASCPDWPRRSARAVGLCPPATYGVRWGSRTHGERLPFMFGLTVAIKELSLLLDVPGPWTTISDPIARALGLTTVFMAVRTVFVLFIRGTRHLFRRQGVDTSS
ncbi:hypothetical protein [Streptomyces kebangsaanensis]|uniref:hypothetical protein n=1 Tax=Streptomyces kebangsaanensis TaxID=864058 RepID=UPI001161169A|nr:hypothetical protein [Streptomyces kebangsaanensis]